MADATLFEDNFTITSINHGKYDRVSRITGSNPGSSISMTLDINSEIYPCSTGETIQLVLASTLNLDGTKDEERMAGRGWRDVMRGPGGGGEATLADVYDYVCRGKIYRFEEAGGDALRVYVSFGGLLLFLEGPFKKLTGLRIDYVYLLVKK